MTTKMIAYPILIPNKNVDWNTLAMNINAIPIIEQNLDLIDPFYSNAIHKPNISPSPYIFLSRNRYACHILKNNLDKVDWRNLSSNPNAIHILEKNLDKINWACLSLNPNAIHLIENTDKMNWTYLSYIPNAIHLIAKYDYLKMKQNSKDFCEELVKQVFHPLRIERLSYIYNFECIDWIEIVS